MTDHPVPSSAALDLVAGAYDTHVHVAPDAMPRRIDDLTLAGRCVGIGLSGFVLKSHYVSTAERAHVVRNAVPGCDVRGGVTLNSTVGGLNPTTVEIAGREGATIVWMPTVDAVNQRESLARDPEGAHPPMWAAVQEDLRRRGMSADPVPVVDGSGAVVPALRHVLEVIAAHGMALATGHLAGPEITSVVRAAVEAGVERIVVTHPEFTSQRLDVETQRELARAGALLERCFTTPYTGKVGWEVMFEHVRAVGVEHSVLSSDLGQPFNPPVEHGMALMAERFLRAGFTEEQVHTMAVRNSRRLVGADVPGGSA